MITEFSFPLAVSVVVVSASERGPYRDMKSILRFDRSMGFVKFAQIVALLALRKYLRYVKSLQA